MAVDPLDARLTGNAVGNIGVEVPFFKPFRSRPDKGGKRADGLKGFHQARLLGLIRREAQGIVTVDFTQNRLWQRK